MLKSIAVCLTILGWLMSSTEHIPFMKCIVARKYCNAIAGVETLERAGSKLSPHDRGFRELAGILSLDTTVRTAVVRIESLGCDLVPSTSIDGQLLETHHRLLLDYGDGRTATTELVRLGETVRQKYYEDSVFRLGSAVFWIGIAMSVYEIYAERKKPQQMRRA